MTEQPPNLSCVPATDCKNSGDPQAWTAQTVAELFQGHHDRLMRCVAAWMPPNLHQKFSAEDVLQEAVIIAIRHPERMTTLDVAPFVWFRSLTREALTERIRAFLGAAKRAAEREIPLDNPVPDLETSRRISLALADHSISPSSVVRRQESAEEVQKAIERLSAADLEIVKLLFFEGLSTSEAAQVLETSESNVSARKLRALGHLKRLMRQRETHAP